jgi:hypothetical protein
VPESPGQREHRCRSFVVMAVASRVVSRLCQGFRENRVQYTILRVAATWRNGDNEMLESNSSSLRTFSSHEVVDPLYALVTMIQKLKHKRITANELYVRRVLRDQIGLSERDIGSLFGQENAPILRRLSVKQNIEPIVLYLRSIGIVGSALVDLIVCEPSIMCTSVDHLHNVHEWLKQRVSPDSNHTSNNGTSHAPAVILRCPRLVTRVSLEDLEKAARVLERSCLHEYPNLVETCVLKYPDQFCRFVQEARDNEDLIDQSIKDLMTVMDASVHDRMSEKRE